MISSIRAQLVPIHRQGYSFVAAFVVATAFFFMFLPPLGWPAALATLWIVYFFRDPPRVTPLTDTLIVAPADGRICPITRAAPPIELGLGERALPRVSIFMSVFDCHVNRSPMPGRIERMIYHPGKFISADLDKASEANERNSLLIAGPAGRIGVVQIAGLVARRIVPFVHEGELVSSGQRIGMIRFGSRLDVYLPEGARLMVGEGQTAVAGETVIADLGTAGPPPAFRAG